MNLKLLIESAKKKILQIKFVNKIKTTLEKLDRFLKHIYISHLNKPLKYGTWMYALVVEQLF